MGKVIHNPSLYLWKTSYARSKKPSTYPQKSVDKPLLLWTTMSITSIICIPFTDLRIFAVDKPVDKRGKICG
jgi:hypothetical protein